MTRWDNAWHQRLNKLLVDLAFRPVEEQSQIRRELAKDPIAFALIYLRHHLRGKETDNRITFSEVHYFWATKAEAWRGISPAQPMAERDAYVGPRAIGKSTWFFLILPLWAAANGHLRFIAAFASAAGQAEGHLDTMRHEFDTNALLRLDYPDLCTPLQRRRGTTVANRQGMIQQASGFTFAARGIDAASLGMKVGNVRPDLLILDDIEPDEANYSAYLAEKRLGTLKDAVFALNVFARVVLVGTVTMPGSIMHQIVEYANGDHNENNAWVKEENISAHHAKPIATNDDGTERSVWPEKWPLEWLQSRRHTREYAKNYDNDPMARDGVYWRREDFLRVDEERRLIVQSCTRWLLQVDPAVTAKSTSDFTGLALVGFSPFYRKCVLRFSAGVRLTGEPLRQYVIQLLSTYPEIKAIRVETNQGGDLWQGVFHDLPGVKILSCTSSVSKEIRFAEALRHWQDGDVLHEGVHSVLEGQAVAFPRGAYDDVIDAGAAGVMYFLGRARAQSAAVKTRSYV